MSEPLKPLIDHGVDPKRITVSAITDPGRPGNTAGWELRASADINDGVVVQMHSVAVSLHTAVAQCVEQLNTAKGIDLKLVGNA